MTVSMPDLDKLARGLTEAQREALLHKKAGGCAYRWATRATLEALFRRKLVFRNAGLGSMFSPSTAIEWPLSLLGLALKAHIERNEG